MTNLIERFIVTVEVNHDKIKGHSVVYGGWTDPKEVAVGLWDRMAKWFGGSGKGYFDFGNGVTLRWESTGLEEVPEESGGDN